MYLISDLPFETINRDVSNIKIQTKGEKTERERGKKRQHFMRKLTTDRSLHMFWTFIRLWCADDKCSSAKCSFLSSSVYFYTHSYCFVNPFVPMHFSIPLRIYKIHLMSHEHLSLHSLCVCVCVCSYENNSIFPVYNIAATWALCARLKSGAIEIQANLGTFWALS